MSYKYPAPAPTISGDIVSISRFLKDPTLIARRLRTLLEQRYISDALLTGRYEAVGGAVLYETAESIYSDDAPLIVTPGGEYPLTSISDGVASMAKTAKWGQDAEITDESIARRKMNPVNKGLLKLVNQNVKTVDSITMSAISSAVTNSTAATASFLTATAAQILGDVGTAKANILALNQGYSPDTVVLDDLRWTHAMVSFIAAGYVPRETSTNNPALTGEFPTILGMKWLASPNAISGTVLVLDSTQLGGMADENLGGPGYVSAAGPNTAPVEVKTIRDDDNDQYRLRARRVTVPIVDEPAAAFKLTSA